MRFKLKKSTAILAIACGAVCLAGLGAGIAMSQNEGLTLEQLVRQAEKKSEAMQGGLTDLVAGAEKRSEIYQPQVSSMIDQNKLALKKAVPFMKDGLPFQYDQAMNGESDDVPASNGVVYIAVSFSMPTLELRQLAVEARKAGAALVIQGPVRGSFKETLRMSQKVFEGSEDGEGMQVDPRVFQQYHVTRVPAFIVANDGVQDCAEEGLECQRAEVPFDVVRGNISLKAALKLLSEKGNVAPDVARRALNKLEG